MTRTIYLIGALSCGFAHTNTLEEHTHVAEGFTLGYPPIPSSLEQPFNQLGAPASESFGLPVFGQAQAQSLELGAPAGETSFGLSPLSSGPFEAQELKPLPILSFDQPSSSGASAFQTTTPSTQYFGQSVQTQLPSTQFFGQTQPGIASAVYGPRGFSFQPQQQFMPAMRQAQPRFQFLQPQQQFFGGQQQQFPASFSTSFSGPQQFLSSPAAFTNQVQQPVQQQFVSASTPYRSPYQYSWQGQQQQQQQQPFYYQAYSLGADQVSQTLGTMEVEANPEDVFVVHQYNTYEDRVVDVEGQRYDGGTRHINHGVEAVGVADFTLEH